MHRRTPTRSLSARKAYAQIGMYPRTPTRWLTAPKAYDIGGQV